MYSKWKVSSEEIWFQTTAVVECFCRLDRVSVPGYVFVYEPLKIRFIQVVSTGHSCQVILQTPISPVLHETSACMIWIRWSRDKRERSQPAINLKARKMLKISRKLQCTVVSSLSPGQTVLPTQANSSQVTKSKLASAGGQTVPPSQTSLQETIQLNEYDRVPRIVT